MATQKKKLTKEERDSCRLITCEARLSYPHLFGAHSIKPGDKKQFSVTLLFPKSQKIIGQAPPLPDGTPGPARSLMTTIKNAKIVSFGDEKHWPDDLQSPVTDGDDVKHKDKEGYAGHWVIKASSNEDQRPSVVGPDMKPLHDASEIYPGCYVRAYIYAHTWEYMGKQGVRFVLDHVQKLRDGKSFGGKKPVDQVFSPVSAPELDEAEDELDFS